LGPVGDALHEGINNVNNQTGDTNHNTETHK
jgi:hypothetical protein